ncbi:Uncharacterised protein [BD1-7 clade bacterium]|uniref:DUF4892 domain-containing protein n=1 Tax=BD1-7 clade bacterium TaxID=2029982 RepID=A0A5S9QMB2_9GAMM|nr:Uncharacterised protein [BD1-7 clade bacterium]
MLRFVCLTFACLFCCNVAWADFILPVNTSLQPVKSAESQEERWLLPLAKYQKINGSWQFDDSLTLSGKLSSNTYLVQSRDQFQQISTFYQTWASQDSIETLYMCKARACGSSNEWANGYFKDRRLYGVQSKQVFWALKSGSQYMAMYLVERGTGQIMLRIDILAVAGE